MKNSGLKFRLTWLTSTPSRRKSGFKKLLATLRPALERYGDWGINSLARDTLACGNGAPRQRAAYARRENFEDVVDQLIEETAQGT